MNDNEDDIDTEPHLRMPDIEPCPSCVLAAQERLGLPMHGPCDLCKGSRVVTAAVAASFYFRRSRSGEFRLDLMDSEPPPKEKP